MEYDFSGWATRNNIKCSDGRTILKDAFKHNDGTTVPVVWNHQHNSPDEVLGHAMLENRDEGVYAYCSFNDTEAGKTAKLLVQHGDINALSIYANQLKEKMGHVMHGNIREVSLVLAGANPGAYIDAVIAHSDSDEWEASIYTGEEITVADKLMHGDENKEGEFKMDNTNPELMHADGKGGGKTLKEVFDTLNEEQKTLFYAMIGQALEDGGTGEMKQSDEYSEGGNEMKHNVFDNDETQGAVLSHADEEMIMDRAKRLGSFRAAMDEFEEANSLQHGFADYESLFPENEWINTPGAPKIIDNDETWVSSMLGKVKKSPMARVRSRYADLREADLRGLGYTKGEEKKLIGQFDMIGRSFDPQTIYVKEQMHRDDVLDITDFDVVNYLKNIMRTKLNLEIARAISIGDGRPNADPDKIKEAHIQPVWGDIELYTIYQDVDIAAAKAELQGTNTGANFGDNYIYAEAIITAALYAREKYKGSGSLDFYCTPHLLNVMLLARDLNGRRIYESKSDLAAALNVRNIYTVEQYEGKTRKTTEGKTKKLLGLFYNFNDYQIGAVQGGQITSFDDFDIDFNTYKYLMETRISGGNTVPFSAIALEEEVSAG